MREAILFWLMRLLVDASTAVLILAALLFAGALFQLRQIIKQSRCDHENVREDMSCTAWCRKCGKNLGFIGNWRNQQEKSK